MVWHSMTPYSFEATDWQMSVPVVLSERLTPEFVMVAESTTPIPSTLAVMIEPPTDPY
jgi:hypothetical protein